MKLRQPIWPRFLSTTFVLNAAMLGPLGRRLSAPGTWGSLAGVLYFTVFFFELHWLEYVVFSLLGLYGAVALCGEAEFRLGRKDPGEVVLDEFAAMPLCYLGWRQLQAQWPTWLIILAGFALFRLYDIVKPFGIKGLQRYPAGWGIVADDVAAALASCLSLHLLARGLAWLP